MRTNIFTAVTNRNVFGFGQGRVVSLWVGSCASAAQHLHVRHASRRARDIVRALKRRVNVTAAAASAAPKAMLMCLAITGPQWQPVRLTSPVLVTTA
jgi:hypothetical protein